MKPDFGATSEDYVRHRGGFPDSLFERLAAYGIGKSGKSIVDLGTGTGTLARGFARRGCRVIGINISEAMIQAARKLDAVAGVSVDYRVTRAEKTGLPSSTFDVVTAGQSWYWFDHPLLRRRLRGFSSEMVSWLLRTSTRSHSPAIWPAPRKN